MVLISVNINETIVHMEAEKLSQELISIGSFSELTEKADDFLSKNKELFLQKLLSLASNDKASIEHELVQKIKDSGVNFNMVLKNIASLYELELLGEHFVDKLDKNSFLEKLTSQHADFSGHQPFITLKQTLIKKLVEAGADINAALRVTNGLKNLLFLSQFFNKIDKKAFLTKVLTTYTSTDVETEAQTQLIEKTVKAGADINNALRHTYTYIHNLLFLEQSSVKIDKDLL